MVKKLFLFTLMFVLVSALILGGCAKPTPTPEKPTPTPEKPIVIRLAAAFSPAEMIIQSMQELETTIPQETNGRVKFEVYPAATLYGFSDALVALQAGELEMTFIGRPSGAVLPEWDVITSLPFLFDDRAHLLRFMETDAYKHVCDRVEAMGIKTLTRVYPYGKENIMNSKRPIEKLEDIQGLKISGPPGGVLTEAYTLWGATPAPIPIPELTTALETGMVDGLECHMVPLPFTDFDRLTPYCTRCNICWFSIGLAASTKWWDTVPPDLQQTLQPIFNDAIDTWGEAIFAFDDAQFEIYKSSPGTVITQLSDAEKARFKDALKPLYDKLKEDPNIREIIEA